MSHTYEEGPDGEVEVGQLVAVALLYWDRECHGDGSAISKASASRSRAWRRRDRGHIPPPVLRPWRAPLCGIPAPYRRIMSRQEVHPQTKETMYANESMGSTSECYQRLHTIGRLKPDGGTE